MYYPILRGRQNELLAVRELVQDGKLAHVVPVIEPVKASSTLLTTIDAVAVKGSGIMIVVNPEVGSFGHDLAHDEGFAYRYENLLSGNERIVHAYRLGKTILPAEEIRLGKTAYFFERGSEKQYQSLSGQRKPDYSFIEAGDSRRKRRAFGGLISLETRYRPQTRNVDYRDHEDDFLSEEHLYFSADGYVGFSDYSIIGEEYSESGFMPQVVAIHLAYFGSEGEVRVRHFTSDDGFAERDVAGKLHSALGKAVSWAREHEVPETDGLREYRAIYETARFPGLGYAKKLSLKHHLEMINNYLDGMR